MQVCCPSLAQRDTRLLNYATPLADGLFTAFQSSLFWTKLMRAILYCCCFHYYNQCCCCCQWCCCCRCQWCCSALNFGFQWRSRIQVQRNYGEHMCLPDQAIGGRGRGSCCCCCCCDLYATTTTQGEREVQGRRSEDWGTEDWGLTCVTGSCCDV